MAHSNNRVITGKSDSYRIKESPGKELVFRDREGKTVVAKAPKCRQGDPSVIVVYGDHLFGYFNFVW